MRNLMLFGFICAGCLREDSVEQKIANQENQQLTLCQTIKRCDITIDIWGEVCPATTMNGTKAVHIFCDPRVLVFGDIYPPCDDLVTVDDLLYVMDLFQENKYNRIADLMPCHSLGESGDGRIDIDDIIAVSDAFIGKNSCD